MKNTKNECVNDFDQLETIAKLIEGITGVAVKKQKAKTRKREVVIARQLTMYFSAIYTQCSLKYIGLYLGNRDHSTVIHGRESIEDLVATNRSFKILFSGIEAQVKALLGIDVSKNSPEVDDNINHYQAVTNQL